MGKNYNQNRKQTSQGIICLTGLFLQSPVQRKQAVTRRTGLAASSGKVIPLLAFAEKSL